MKEKLFSDEIDWTPSTYKTLEYANSSGVNFILPSDEYTNKVLGPYLKMVREPHKDSVFVQALKKSLSLK